MELRLLPFVVRTVIAAFMLGVAAHARGLTLHQVAEFGACPAQPEWQAGFYACGAPPSPALDVIVWFIVAIASVTWLIVNSRHLRQGILRRHDQEAAAVV